MKWSRDLKWTSLEGINGPKQKEISCYPSTQLSRVSLHRTCLVPSVAVDLPLLYWHPMLILVPHQTNVVTTIRVHSCRLIWVHYLVPCLKAHQAYTMNTTSQTQFATPNMFDEYIDYLCQCIGSKSKSRILNLFWKQ